MKKRGVENEERKKKQGTQSRRDKVRVLRILTMVFILQFGMVVPLLSSTFLSSLDLKSGGRGNTAGNGGSDQSRGVGNGLVHRGVLVQVLGAAEVGEVDGEEVAVGESIRDAVQPLPVLDRLSSHLVESGLDRGRLVLGKGLAGDLTDAVVDLVEGDLAESGQNLLRGRDGRDVVLPLRINAGGEDAVLGFGQGGVLVTDKVLKSRSSALQDQQAGDGRLELNRAAGAGLATLDEQIRLAGLLTISPERVVVGLAVDDHASPAVTDDRDMSTLNPGVGVQEVVAELSSEELQGIDDLGRLGDDVAGVLHGVGGNDSLVGSLGVGGGEGRSREENTDGQVVDTVDLGVLVDLEKADAILSVLLLVEKNFDVGHCGCVGWLREEERLPVGYKRTKKTEEWIEKGLLYQRKKKVGSALGTEASGGGRRSAEADGLFRVIRNSRSEPTFFFRMWGSDPSGGCAVPEPVRQPLPGSPCPSAFLPSPLVSAKHCRPVSSAILCRSSCFLILFPPFPLPRNQLQTLICRRDHPIDLSLSLSLSCSPSSSN